MEIQDIKLKTRIIFLAENTNLTIQNIIYVLDITNHEEFINIPVIVIENILYDLLLFKLGINVHIFINPVPLKTLEKYSPKVQDELINYANPIINNNLEIVKSKKLDNSEKYKIERCQFIYKNKTKCRRHVDGSKYCYLHSNLIKNTNGK